VTDSPRRPRLFLAFAASLLLCASRASAQTAPPAPRAAAPQSHWSIATGETVSPDRDAIDFAAGWPGLRFDFIHGTSDRSDVGIRVEMLYSQENTTTTRFGLGAAVPFRLVVSSRDNVLLGLHVDPGVRLYTSGPDTDLLLRLPVGGIVGVQVTPNLRVAGGVDLNMALQVTNRSLFEINPSVGFGIEGDIQRGLVAGLNARFGPQYVTLANTGGVLAMTFEALIGYRM
jgi:hypothetical protein